MPLSERFGGSWRAHRHLVRKYSNPTNGISDGSAWNYGRFSVQVSDRNRSSNPVVSISKPISISLVPQSARPRLAFDRRCI